MQYGELPQPKLLLYLCDTLLLATLVANAGNALHKTQTVQQQRIEIVIQDKKFFRRTLPPSRWGSPLSLLCAIKIISAMALPLRVS